VQRRGAGRERYCAARKGWAPAAQGRVPRAKNGVLPGGGVGRGQTPVTCGAEDCFAGKGRALVELGRAPWSKDRRLRVCSE